MTTGFTAIKNKLNMNLGATFDPYALDENKKRYGTFNFKNGGSLLRMTSANINMNFSISNKDFNKDKKPDKNDDCLLYTSPSPRDRTRSRMPSSA